MMPAGGGWGLALLVVVVACAYGLKAFTGFGPALLLVPVLAALYDPMTALVASAGLDVVAGVILLGVIRPAGAVWRAALGVCALVGAGAGAGAVLAGVVPPAALLGAMACALAGAAWLTWRGAVWPWRHAAGAGALLGGISGGVAGISGPFVIAGLAGRAASRALLTIVFLAESVARLAVYVALGVATVAAPVIWGIAALPALVGGAIGLVLHRRSDARSYARAVALILMALAVGLAILAVAP